MMKVSLTSWSWAAVAVLALAGGARAIEGEPTPETLEKLAKRVNIQEGAIPLVELAARISEQTGLSFVASAHVAHMPEPVAIIARDVPAGEILEAIAFSMDLEFEVSPGGVVAIRLDHEDPRREAMIDREFRRHERGDGAGEGGEPEIGEDELVERVGEHPKVRGILDRFQAHLLQPEFHREKRVWIVSVAPNNGEKPFGEIIATEDGDILDIRFRGKGGAPEKERRDKRFEKERKEKRPERAGDEWRFREDEAREREGRENF
jgi:hypothetical protein